MEERSVGREVRMLANLIKREFENFDSVRESKRLTGMHGFVLGFLYDRGGRDVFQRDVEAEFSIRRSTATEILQLMERNGLIFREGVPYDARLKKLTLTLRGREIHERVIAEIRGMEQRLREGIGEREIAGFFDILDRMRANLENRSAAGQK